VVFGVDRAGLVGADGETHHGCFDALFLPEIPGFTVLCPASFAEMHSMLRQALFELTGPVAVRYPRGAAQYGVNSFSGDPQDVIRHAYGEDATLISYGPLLGEAAMTVRMLKGNGDRADIDIGLLQLLSPTDFSPERLVSEVRGKHIFVAEEVSAASGIGADIALCLSNHGLDCQVHSINLGCDFVPHGDTRSLYRLTGIDNGAMTEHIREVLSHEN